jgi:hypothetical protein
MFYVLSVACSAVLLASSSTHEFRLPPSATLTTPCGFLGAFKLYYAYLRLIRVSTLNFTSLFLRHRLVNLPVSFWVLSTQLGVAFPALGYSLQCFLRSGCSTCCFCLYAPTNVSAPFSLCPYFRVRQWFPLRLSICFLYAWVRRLPPCATLLGHSVLLGSCMLISAYSRPYAFLALTSSCSFFFACQGNQLQLSMYCLYTWVRRFPPCATLSGVPIYPV